MNKLVIKQTGAIKVEIFIAGSQELAEAICEEYCDRVGLCVTVEMCNYIYTKGSEMGVRVGLINYARFPSGYGILNERALELAFLLRDGMGQESFTIQDDRHSTFYSIRDVDQ